MIKVITNSFIKLYCEKMSRARKGKTYFTRCFTKKKLQITRVYSIFPITFAIASLLKSGLNQNLVVLEPFTHNTADLKDSFSLSH